MSSLLHSVTIPLALKASPSGRHLVTAATNEPFIWAADTAWSLFHVCTREEAIWYLDQRRRQGFTVILSVVVSEQNGLDTPNAYGEYIFMEDESGKRLDPTRWNEAYFKHIDWVVEQAAQRSLIIGLVPTWGKYINSGWAGSKDLLFNDENAAVFGDYIGSRYPGLPKIIGGDTNPYWFDTSSIWPAVMSGNVPDLPPTTDTRSIMRAMGRAIVQAETRLGVQAFQTYHPTAMWLSDYPEARAAAYFDEDDDWLSMDSVQTGHANFRTITTNPLLSWWDCTVPHIAVDKMWKDASVQEGSLAGKRPVMDLEPHYEGMRNGLLGTNPRFFVAEDIRNGTYSSVFSGSCGWTYGANSIWQMYEPEKGRKAVCGLSPASSWKKDLENFRGAPQLQVLTKLLSTLDRQSFDSRIPDQECLLEGAQTGEERITITRDGRNTPTFLWAYSGQGESFKLDLTMFDSNRTLKGRWLAPETGEYGDAFECKAEAQWFTPPSSTTSKQDWVLYLRSE